jgi:superfamily II DNA/RNA helicase
MIQKMLRDPVEVRVGPVSTPIAKINQRAVRINGDQKNDRLLDEINQRQGSVLVFIRTQRRTDRVAKFLASYGLSVARIHGSRTQGQRNQAMKGFKDESFRILCATDIAARGLDISHVAHVINYDLPQVPEDYVHRIGRTARNGRDGDSISFISSDEVEQWKAIEKLLKSKGALPQVENAIVGSKKLHGSAQVERQGATGLMRPTRQAQKPRAPQSQVSSQTKRPLPKNIRFKHESRH